MQNSWIKSLYRCARKVCLSTEKIKSQIDKIKLFISRNEYPLHIRNSFIKWLRYDSKTKGNDEKNKENKILWTTLPYLGHTRKKTEENMPKKCPKISNRKGLFFNALETKTFCNILLHQRHYSHIPKIKFWLLVNMSW